MDKIILGQTGLEVSRLSFGGIPFGGRGWRKDPYVPPKVAAKVLKRAFDLGINFWDTAERYGSYPHFREGLKLVNREKIILSTKTREESYEGAKTSIRNSLQELGTEYIDIYYLHFVNELESLEARRRGALKALIEAKEKGLVRHIGLSTHRSNIVEKALEIPEIEVFMVKMNKIEERMQCTLKDMLKAAKKAYEKGKGIVVIKILAYGKLTVEEGLEWALNLPFVHSVCLGMRTMQELEEDVEIYNKIMAKRRKG